MWLPSHYPPPPPLTQQPLSKMLMVFTGLGERERTPAAGAAAGAS